MTTASAPIAPACGATARVSAKLRGLAQPGDLETALSGLYWPLYPRHYQGDGRIDDSQLRRDLQQALEQLAGVVPSREPYSGRPTAWQKLVEIAVPMQDSNRFNPSNHWVVAPAGHLALLGRIFEMIVALLAAASQDGYERGSSLITRLANGDLAMNDLLDPAARKR